MNDMEFMRLKYDKAWLRHNYFPDKFRRTKTTYEEFIAPAHEYNPKVRVDQPLTIYQLAPAFILFCFGIAVSILSMGVEFCTHVEGIQKLTIDVRQFIFWAIIEFIPDNPTS